MGWTTPSCHAACRGPNQRACLTTPTKAKREKEQNGSQEVKGAHGRVRREGAGGSRLGITVFRNGRLASGPAAKLQPGAKVPAALFGQVAQALYAFRVIR